MFTRILVPLDGSSRAEQAIPMAARIARATNGTVALVQVVDITRQLATSLGPMSIAPEIIEAHEATTANYLRGIAATETLANIQTERHVLIGSPAMAILDAIALERIDLIVMASHGRTGLTRWALGSVAQQLARHATVPVVVLRADGTATDEQASLVEQRFRILAALDGSSFAEVALEPAAELLAALAPGQGALHLLLVLLPYEADVERMPDGLAMQGAMTYLGNVAKRLQVEHLGLKVTWTVAAQLDTAAAILRVAAKSDELEGIGLHSSSDMIAMATHGYSGLKHWMMGSITERVLQSAKLPLLIVPPAATPTHRDIHA